MAINFTKEHYAKLKELAFDMLVSNDTIPTKLGQSLTILELMHTTTINTLNGLKQQIAKQIDNLENQDEWASSEHLQSKLSKLKAKKELVNLIVGWKRYSEEREELSAKKEELSIQLKKLKEAQKTPEERIKELEEQITGITMNEEF